MVKRSKKMKLSSKWMRLYDLHSFRNWPTFMKSVQDLLSKLWWVEGVESYWRSLFCPWWRDTYLSLDLRSLSLALSMEEGPGRGDFSICCPFGCQHLFWQNRTGSGVTASLSLSMVMRLIRRDESWARFVKAIIHIAFVPCFIFIRFLFSNFVIS